MTTTLHLVLTYEFAFCDYFLATSTCQEPLGMENYQLSATSDQGNEYKARLNKNGDYWDSGSGFAPGWIQVDLLDMHTVTRVKTRVRGEIDGNFRLIFNVLCSNHSDGSSFKPIYNNYDGSTYVS